MIRLSEIKRDLSRKDGEIKDIFRLAILVLAYCFQLSFFFAIFTLCVFVAASSDMIPEQRWLYGSLTFCCVAAAAFVLALWFLRSVLSMNESTRKTRKKNGQWDVKRGVRVDGGKNEKWLIGGELYSSEEVKRLKNGR